MLGISAMFFILFRNITLAVIGVVPNFIAAFFILGIIGLMEIPLDMMTITIAAITIVFGFSILVFSNFIPTIYFGVFTGIAMLLAMISVLTLLPTLILLTKPFAISNNK